MLARSNLHAISFGLWHTQTYDRHMLQNGSHLTPFQLLHELDNVEKQNPLHDDKVYHQLYYTVGIGSVFSVTKFVRCQAEKIGFGDKR